MNSVLSIALISLLCANGALGSFKYLGLSESGPEWGSNIPGVNNVDYVFPTTSSIDYYVSNGMNVIRLPFLWERIQPSLNGNFDSAYLALIDKTVQYVTVTKGIYCLLDLHNYARYNDAVLGSGVDYSAFQFFWNKLAAIYKSNPKVMFGLMNEPHDLPNANVFAAMQAGVNGVRAAGATQLITVPGNDWTGAHSWVSGGSSAVMGGIIDPLNNFMYEMHQYFDSDFSGTGACNVNFDPATIFGPATDWLRSQGKKGFLGEFGIENNANCVAVLARTMAYLDTNSDVWQGLTWWAVGPWWGSYMYTLDAGKGDAQLAVLKNYMPSGSTVPVTPVPVTPTPVTPTPVTPAPVTPVPVPTHPVSVTSTSTSGRAKPMTTGIKKPSPPSTPVTPTPVTPTPVTPTPTSNSCTLGQSRCVGSSSYQTCGNGRDGPAWAASQQCQAGLSCHATGSAVYCY